MFEYRTELRRTAKHLDEAVQCTGFILTTCRSPENPKIKCSRTFHNTILDYNVGISGRMALERPFS